METEIQVTYEVVRLEGDGCGAREDVVCSEEVGVDAVEAVASCDDAGFTSRS